jgi:dTDP-3-amino-3,4,6-trideoxy-alpha-D-glucose transaminase
LHLDVWSAGRRATAERYREAGLGDYVELPRVPEGAQPAWHLFVVAHPQADALIAQLRGSGIGARGYYRTPVHRQPAIAPYVRGSLSLPVTDQLASANLALPMGPALECGDVEAVVSALERATAAAPAR